MKKLIALLFVLTMIVLITPAIALEFTMHQKISTSGASDWESFDINGETYLAVANHHNDSSYDTDSIIYKWDNGSFSQIQAIPTHGAKDWESFNIGDDTFLAVANYRQEENYSYNIDSAIYKWNGSSFTEFQSIPTHGAYSWESFNIEGTQYLAVANSGTGSNNNIDSKIYKWNGEKFNTEKK